MNYYDLRSVIDGTIIQLKKLREELELDKLTKEKGLSEADRAEVEKVLRLMNEAESLYKMHERVSLNRGSV